MEFICCNQTLGLVFIIIIIHRAQVPRLASHFSKASRLFVAQPLTPAYPMCNEKAQLQLRSS